MKTYNIKKTSTPIDLGSDWNSDPWSLANILELNEVRIESSDHHPKTELKLLYDNTSIYGLFRVQDNYIKAVHTGFQDSVSKDSCVEFFIKPKSEGGYFNFEFNCSGAMLCFYIVDPTRNSEEKRRKTPEPNEFVDYTPLAISELQQVKIYHSMPERVFPEITEPTEWLLGFKIPLNILEKYSGELGNLSGKTWEANCYKCASKTSHPHWLSWNPVTVKDFHLPECFGKMKFET